MTTRVASNETWYYGAISAEWEKGRPVTQPAESAASGAEIESLARASRVASNANQTVGREPSGSTSFSEKTCPGHHVTFSIPSHAANAEI